MARKFHYGGQALIEGVMMRGEKHMAVAVRLPDGAIKLACHPVPRIYSGKLREIVFVRGVIVLLETLLLGLRALLFSADAQRGEAEEMGKGAMWGTLALALGFAVALFFVTPLLLSRLLYGYFASALLVNLIEGAIRLAILVGYLWSIGLSREIRRVFAYHGAEHKAVNALEHGAPLEVQDVRPYRTAHVRCGTSFLLAVVIVAILLFALLGKPSLWFSIVSRIVFLPLIAGLAYEFIRLSADHADRWFMQPLMVPGLALQSLTTREPDDGQIEVAISALQEVLRADNPLPAPPPNLTAPGAADTPS